MDSLNKDVLFNIATMLDLDNLLSFCNSDPRINRLVCQGEAIWNFKLAKEFPDYKAHINQRGREAYELLVALVKLKKVFKYQRTIYELYKETNLKLSYGGWTELPSEIGKLNQLEVLSLNGNQIESLPPEIGRLSNLRKLYLGNNKITSLPPEIGNLTRLQIISLTRNKIESLPSEISKLSNLQQLSLDGNQIKLLPSKIGNLTALSTLSLRGNQIEILPPEVGNLINLTGLYLDNNQIKILPTELVNLKKLIDLHIDIEVIVPSELKHLPITRIKV